MYTFDTSTALRKINYVFLGIIPHARVMHSAITSIIIEDFNTLLRLVYTHRITSIIITNFNTLIRQVHTE